MARLKQNKKRKEVGRKEMKKQRINVKFISV